jgi:hypothetical protein
MLDALLAVVRLLIAIGESAADVDFPRWQDTSDERRLSRCPTISEEPD